MCKPLTQPEMFLKTPIEATIVMLVSVFSLKTNLRTKMQEGTQVKNKLTYLKLTSELILMTETGLQEESNKL